MDMNRSRPPKGGDAVSWFAGVVNDACRDAREAGVEDRMIMHMLLTLAKTEKELGGVLNNVYYEAASIERRVYTRIEEDAWQRLVENELYDLNEEQLGRVHKMLTRLLSRR